MAIRCYLTSKTTDATGAFCPAGFTTLSNWQAMDYGREDLFIVRGDISDADHATLQANSAVFACPDNLSATISSADLITLQAQLSVRRVPTAWMSTSHTYRQVLKAVAKYCALLQRLCSGRTTAAVRTIVDSNIENLTAGQKTVLQNVFGPLVDVPLSTSGPVKDAIRDLAEALPPRVTSALIFLGAL